MDSVLGHQLQIENSLQEVEHIVSRSQGGQAGLLSLLSMSAAASRCVRLEKVLTIGLKMAGFTYKGPSGVCPCLL